jgi:hypothetical protein
MDNREWPKIRRAAERQGWLVEETKHGYMLKSPDGGFSSGHGSVPRVDRPARRRSHGSTDAAAGFLWPEPRRRKAVMFEIEIETFGDPSTYDDEVIAELPGVLARLGAAGPVGSLGGVAGGPGASFGVGDELDPSDPAAVPTALRTGLEMFDAACEQLALSHGGFARAVVVTDEMLQRELAQDPESYLGVTEVAQELGVSRQRVAELRTMRDFPEPVAHLAAGPIWRSSTLRRFVEDWERKPGRPRKVAATGSG